MARGILVSTLVAGAAVLAGSRTDVDVIAMLSAGVSFLVVALLLTVATSEVFRPTIMSIERAVTAAAVPVAAANLIFSSQDVNRWAGAVMLGAVAVVHIPTSSTAVTVALRRTATVGAVFAVAAPLAGAWAERDRLIVGHVLVAAAATVSLAAIVGPLLWWIQWHPYRRRRPRIQLLTGWNRTLSPVMLISSALWLTLMVIGWAVTGSLSSTAFVVGAAWIVAVVLSQSISMSITNRREPQRWRVLATVAAVGVMPLISVTNLAPSEAPALTTNDAVAATASSETTSPTLTEFEECARVVDYLAQKDCYSKFFIDYAAVSGTEASLDLLLELYNQNIGRTFRNHCHEVLHDVAFAEAVRLGGPEKLFPYYRVTCTGGFSHGILVAYTAELGWEAIEAQLPTFCRTLTDEVVKSLIANGEQVTSDSWIEWACNHMIGHELYRNSRDDHARGAALCNTWAFPDDRHTNCTAGFFMEHFLDTGRQQNGWTRPTTVEEVFRFCVEMPIEVRRGCYNEVGANILAYSGADWDRAFALCRDNTPEKWHDQCYDSLARMVTVYSGFDTQTMIDTCQSVRDVDELAADVCGDAIAGALVMEVQNYEDAVRVCDEVVRDAEWFERCQTRVEGVSQQIENSGLSGSVMP